MFVDADGAVDTEAAAPELEPSKVCRSTRARCSTSPLRFRMEDTARCCAMLSIRLAWQAVAIDLDDPHQIIGPVVGCVSKLAAAQPDEVVALGGDRCVSKSSVSQASLTSAVIAPRHTADTPQSLTCTE